MKSYVLAVVLLVSLTVLVDCFSTPEPPSRRPPPPSRRPPPPSRRPPPPSRRPPPPPPKHKHCRTTEDCDQDQCCIGNPFRGGRCKALGREGKKCIHELKFNGVHMMECPCLDGLECLAQETVTRPGGTVIHIRPRCTNPNATTTVDEVSTIDDVSSEEGTPSSEERSYV